MSGGTPVTEVADARNVLLLGPSVNDDVDAACRDLLPAASGTYVIAVNFSPTPSTWLDRYAATGADPAGLVLVTTNPAGIDADDYPWPLAVEGISTPGDLTGVGMVVSKYLERWHGADEVVLCFDSLTALLQYEEPQNVYRFLHIISTRLAGAGARAHFHLDPATQDDKVVSTLRSPFDAVAEYDDGWRVARR
ncbi:DUF7504 family protein [Halosegnis marinus]|uniref:DUF835 domain-containing protein n=1 Tax=Halosegnis marinus TaxID=3034023 RepID=A0ABD5ZMS3_9EURY|nr:hypothetical protein [Halosegnis sp. DT85]